MAAHMLIDDCGVDGSDGAGDAVKPSGNSREGLHHTLLDTIEPQTLLLNHAFFAA